LFAQPLAWLEASNLPDSAYNVSDMLVGYRKVQHDIHRGVILPIGEEPNGFSWTGFQSLLGDEGYLIVYRELNEKHRYLLKTYLPPNAEVRFSHILGHGKSFIASTDDEGNVEFTLPDRHSFALYRYKLQGM
jgi:alpha-galactosidase